MVSITAVTTATNQQLVFKVHIYNSELNILVWYFIFDLCFLIFNFILYFYLIIFLLISIMNWFPHKLSRTDWEVEPRDRKWHMNKANYYFPKIDRYPDLKTATLIFIASSLGLIVLISALIILLYRIGARARQQRELQSRLETISELLGAHFRKKCDWYIFIRLFMQKLKLRSKFKIWMEALC